MASIQKLKKKNSDIAFQIQLSINGARDSETFNSKEAARIWALNRDAEILSQLRKLRLSVFVKGTL